MEEKTRSKDGIDYKLPKDMSEHIIKVVGVGGGSNAVRNMYQKGVQNVTFAVCNTDSQALSKSPVPIKLQLGEGLGVGGNPILGKEAAEKGLENIQKLFDEDTQMLFLTAGMGGGTGTGAAPVIAKVARERGILTVGVVTLPFAFEKKDRIEKALVGVEEMKKNVDALLVINNERLLQLYDDQATSIQDAFGKANDILTIATKSIAEIITVEGVINRDFNDVKTVMKDGGTAIMSVGYGSGENRIQKAMKEALNSPLFSFKDISQAKKLLYIIYTCKDSPVLTSELRDVNDFMDTLSDDLEVLRGLYEDDTLGDQVKVAIVATGIDGANMKKSNSDTSHSQDDIERLKNEYYPFLKDKSAKMDQREEAIETNIEMVTDESCDCEATDPYCLNDAKVTTNWVSKFAFYIKKLLEEE